MNLRYLEIFSAVMRTRTTIAAAFELGVSQPAVSNAVKHLESQIGFLLFERTGNRLVPTAEAVALYQDAEPLHAMAQAITQKMRDLRDSKCGNLRILATQALSRTVASEALGRFLKKRPDVHVYFDVRRLEGVVESVESGLVDLGLAVMPGHRPNMEVVPLSEKRMVAAIPDGHPLLEKNTLTLKDFSSHRIIGIEPASRLGGLVRHKFEEAGESYNPVMEVRHSTTACMMVEQKVGITVVDEFTVGDPCQWRLNTRPLEPAIRVTAAAMYLRNRSLSRIAAHFLDDVIRGNK
jgi:DNA-binding transcriptional LysR family regulator